MKTIYWVSTLLFLATVSVFWMGGVLTTPPAEGAQPNQQYSLADVARHARAGDCWMAIADVVYDFTAYLPLHPTAPDVIVPSCGKEATQAYKTKNRNRPHSAYADELLVKYRIGVLKK